MRFTRQVLVRNGAPAIREIVLRLSLKRFRPNNSL